MVYVAPATQLMIDQAQSGMIKVVLFEDNKNFRESLSLFLETVEGISLKGVFGDARDAVSVCKKYQPDVILMDIEMPFVSGIEAIIEIKKVIPEAKILIQTVFESDDKIFQAICAGANGYIVKTPDSEKYIEAIKDVHNGGSHLSPSISARVLKMFQSNFVKEQPHYTDLSTREKEVLSYLTKGYSYKMIAEACFISYFTVNSHVKKIYDKLHVNSASEAILKAIEMHLI